MSVVPLWFLLFLFYGVVFFLKKNPLRFLFPSTEDNFFLTKFLISNLERMWKIHIFKGGSVLVSALFFLCQEPTDWYYGEIQRAYEATGVCCCCWAKSHNCTYTYKTPTTHMHLKREAILVIQTNFLVAGLTSACSSGEMLFFNYSAITRVITCK